MEPGPPALGARIISYWTAEEVPMDSSPPGSSVHGISQAGILKRVAFPSPGDLPHAETETVTLTSPALAGGFFTTSATWEAFPGGSATQLGGCEAMVLLSALHPTSQL